MKPVDLKGFDHDGVSWSWPEFDELGLVSRPAHAHAGLPGRTACGERWPHTYSTAKRCVIRHPAPNEPADAIPPAAFTPSPARIEEIRWAEDRTRFLCKTCLLKLPGL